MDDRRKAEWPHRQFRDYLQVAMDRRGISNRAELSRLSGVGQQQLSNWWNGKSRPSRDLLRRLTPVLNVELAALELAAGLSSEEDLIATRNRPILHPDMEHAIHVSTRIPADIVPGMMERIRYATEWAEHEMRKRSQ